MSRIFIGMGTCGLATGAGQVKTAVEKWAAARAMQVEITPTGCMTRWTCPLHSGQSVRVASVKRCVFSNRTPQCSHSYS